MATEYQIIDIRSVTSGFNQSPIPEVCMRETKTKRLQKQRERQAEYRAQQKRARRPTRDDVARIALHWLIVSMDKKTKETGDPSGQQKVEDILLQRLVAQGFDERGSEDVLADLTEKYVEQGWDFQRKPHLARAVNKDQD